MLLLDFGPVWIRIQVVFRLHVYLSLCRSGPGAGQTLWSDTAECASAELQRCLSCAFHEASHACLGLLASTNRISSNPSVSMLFRDCRSFACRGSRRNSAVGLATNVLCFSSRLLQPSPACASHCVHTGSYFFESTAVPLIGKVMNARLLSLERIALIGIGLRPAKAFQLARRSDPFSMANATVTSSLKKAGASFLSLHAHRVLLR